MSLPFYEYVATFPAQTTNLMEFFTDSFTQGLRPEPSTLLQLGAGLAGLAGLYLRCCA